MSSQRQTPQEDNKMNDINNNTALMTMDETDQETNNGHLVRILKSENLEGVLPLAEDFIMSRVSGVHSLYLAQAGVGLRLPFKPALLKGCRHKGTQASIHVVPASL